MAMMTGLLPAIAWMELSVVRTNDYYALGKRGA